MTSPFASMLPRPALPESAKAAMLRGATGKCPRCGDARLFARFLKPVKCCPGCGQDWTLHRADDFPPYVSIIVSGHVMAPVIVALDSAESLPMWVRMAICVGIAAVMVLGLLQPAKGAVIALQWWLGLEGFPAAGRDEAARGRGAALPARTPPAGS